MSTQPLLFPPTSTRQTHYSHSFPGLDLIRNNFSFTTLLLLGAFLQSLLLLLPIPRLYLLLPSLLVLSLRAIDTALITYGWKPNPYLAGVIPKTTTGQMLSNNGEYTGPGERKIAILLLGVRINHPLGLFAPHFRHLGDLQAKMYDQLTNEVDQKESGFLGHSSYTRSTASGGTELVGISYWRGLDDVHRYAHGPLHREAWDWWRATLKKNQLGHVGLFHEVFESDSKKYETLYINLQPILFGSTAVEREVVGESDGLKEGRKEWVMPLLDATKGRLRTSHGRRGVGTGSENEKYDT
jgi:heme-degrading monooxygenase HmoA